jgi:hypothetical protein
MFSWNLLPRGELATARAHHRARQKRASFLLTPKPVGLFVFVGAAPPIRRGAFFMKTHFCARK